MKYVRIAALFALVALSFASVTHALANADLDRFYYVDATYTAPEVGEYYRPCTGPIQRWGIQTNYWRDYQSECMGSGFSCETCIFVDGVVYCEPGC